MSEIGFRKNGKRVTLYQMGVRTLIGADASTSSSITADKGVGIKGKIGGDLIVKGDDSIAVIYPGAVVEGDVFADVIIVAGEVKGNVNGKVVHVHGTGIVYKDVIYGKINIAQHGKVLGKTITQKEVVMQVLGKQSEIERDDDNVRKSVSSLKEKRAEEKTETCFVNESSDESVASLSDGSGIVLPMLKRRAPAGE